jgi:hypothetical protein
MLPSRSPQAATSPTTDSPRRRCVALAVAGTLAVASLLAMAIPTNAHATSYNSLCEEGEICLYQNYDFVGRVVWDRNAIGPCWTLSVGIAGKLVSAYWNRTNRTGHMTGPASGAWLGMYPGRGSLDRSSLNDNVSAVANC